MIPSTNMASQKPTSTFSQLFPDRISIRARLALATALVLFICVLWGALAIPRSAELNNLATAQNRTPPTIMLKGATAPIMPTRTSTGANDHLAVELAVISIMLVLIGVLIRAWTTDIYQEMLDERLGEVKGHDRAITGMQRRAFPIQVALERTSRWLDLAPEAILNDLRIQTVAWSDSRDRRAAGRPHGEGVWETAEERKKFASEDPTQIYDPAIPTKERLAAMITDLRAKARASDPENESATLLSITANKRIKAATGIDLFADSANIGAEEEPAEEKPAERSPAGGRRGGRGRGRDVNGSEK